MICAEERLTDMIFGEEDDESDLLEMTSSLI